MKKRSEISQTARVSDISGGMIRKLDASKIDTRFCREAKNVRFQTGAVATRPGTVRAAQLTRPTGALTFPGDTSSYVYVPPNLSCPIWSGLPQEFTIEWVERLVSTTPGSGTEGRLFGVDDGASFDSFCVTKPVGTTLGRTFRAWEDGEGAYKQINMGNITAGRRFYCRIRRKGRLLDTLIRGYGEIGDQAGSDTTFFVSPTSTLKTSATIKSLFVGGNFYGGTIDGCNTKIDVLRITGRYIEDTDKSTWTGAPILEDPKLYIWLDFDEGPGADIKDDSLWGNHGLLVDSPVRIDGLIEGLMVGQAVDEFAPPGKNHRIVVAGGSIFREVVV